MLTSVIVKARIDSSLNLYEHCVAENQIRFGRVGRGYPPATYTIPLAPADFVYHEGGTPHALFFFQKKKVPKKFVVQLFFFSGFRPEKKCGSKIAPKGRFLA